MDSASLLVEFEKKFFVLGLTFSEGGRHKWVCHSCFLAYFTRPWTPFQWPSSLTQICFRN